MALASSRINSRLPPPLFPSSRFLWVGFPSTDEEDWDRPDDSDGKMIGGQSRTFSPSSLSVVSGFFSV
ncbi:unnamed protein product, partial [Musa acuminata var. zebrina]